MVDIPQFLPEPEPRCVPLTATEWLRWAPEVRGARLIEGVAGRSKMVKELENLGGRPRKWP